MAAAAIVCYCVCFTFRFVVSLIISLLHSLSSVTVKLCVCVGGRSKRARCKIQIKIFQVIYIDGHITHVCVDEMLLLLCTFRFTSDYTLRVSLSYTTAAVLGSSPPSMRTRARPHRLRICVEVPSWKQYVPFFLFLSRVLASPLASRKTSACFCFCSATV